MVKVQVKVKVQCLYLYWITLSAIWAGLPWGPVRPTPHMSSVTTGGNRSSWRKPVMLARVKLDNILLTWRQGNFNQITVRSQNRTLVTVVRDMCITTVTPPLPVFPVGISTEKDLGTLPIPLSRTSWVRPLTCWRGLLGEYPVLMSYRVLKKGISGVSGR